MQTEAPHGRFNCQRNCILAKEYLLSRVSLYHLVIVNERAIALYIM
jgi:hypothetical protein